MLVGPPYLRILSLDRDFSRGIAVRFLTTRPKELEKVIADDKSFALFVETINAQFKEAEEVNGASVCEVRILSSIASYASDSFGVSVDFVGLPLLLYLFRLLLFELRACGGRY